MSFIATVQQAACVTHVCSR